MRRVCMAMCCLLLMLVGCRSNVPAAAPPAVSDTAQPSAIATPQLSLVTTPTPAADGVWRSPLDNMPIIMGRADLAPQLVDGVLRSPLDQMPILPGDQQTAPMPNLAVPPFAPSPTP